MKKFLVKFLTAIGLVLLPHAAQASCGSSLPYVFAARTSPLTAATTNTNNNFLLSCATSIDTTQIGSTGLNASDIKSTTSSGATFGGNQTYQFVNGLSSGTPAANLLGGDISAARSANTGVLYFGSATNQGVLDYGVSVSGSYTLGNGELYDPSGYYAGSSGAYTSQLMSWGTAFGGITAIHTQTDNTFPLFTIPSTALGLYDNPGGSHIFSLDTAGDLSMLGLLNIGGTIQAGSNGSGEYWQTENGFSQHQYIDNADNLGWYDASHSHNSGVTVNLNTGLLTAPSISTPAITATTGTFPGGVTTSSNVLVRSGYAVPLFTASGTALGSGFTHADFITTTLTTGGPCGAGQCSVVSLSGNAVFSGVGTYACTVPNINYPGYGYVAQAGAGSPLSLWAYTQQVSASSVEFASNQAVGTAITAVCTGY